MTAPGPLRMGGRWLARAGVGLLFLLPLALALGHGLANVADGQAWRDLLAEPALPAALMLSVGVAVLSTVGTVLLLLWAVPHLHGQRAWQWLQAALGPLLAVPHAAFALGLAFWLMPSGWLARGLAPVLGWTAPPDVASVRDPWGLGLSLALVAKELPFLLWCVMALLARAEQAAALPALLRVGRSLGYGPVTLWWRVIWPQVLPQLGWPLAALWAYSMTVVDMALVLGPARPPTLAKPYRQRVPQHLRDLVLWRPSVCRVDSLCGRIEVAWRTPRNPHAYLLLPFTD